FSVRCMLHASPATTKEGGVQMCEQERWRQLIENAERPKPVEATTFLQWEGASVQQREGNDVTTASFTCNDGERYVVKMPEPESTRIIVNDQVVSRLGKALGAPVAEVQLVRVSADLLASLNLQRLPINVFHGSRYIQDCLDSEEISDH